MTRILVVDDEESLRDTLGTFLREAGYEVEVADDVAKARQLLKEKIFDVVLTDIVMPRITGVELLQAIHQESPGVQVIMMTGQPTVETAAAVVRSGAFDYLTKPIARDDILRCVANAARLKATEDERARLAEANRRDQEELEARYHRLRELETLRDNLVHIIVHDMRSPLTLTSGYLDLFKEGTAVALNDEDLGFIDTACKNTTELLEMVTTLRDVSRMEAGQMPLSRKSCDLAAVTKEVVESFGSLVGQRQLSIEAQPESILASVDKEVLQRIIANLVGNAIKFTPDGGRIHITISRKDSMARLTVTDTGPGIPVEYHAKIFEKFGQVDKQTGRYPAGLDFSFCRLAVESHGGKIGVESQSRSNSTYWFTLPLNKEQSAS